MAAIAQRDPSVAQARATCGVARHALLRSRRFAPPQLEADIRICEEFLERDRERAARASSGARLRVRAAACVASLTRLRPRRRRGALLRRALWRTLGGAAAVARGRGAVC
jgi:hypothetical protein